MKTAKVILNAKDITVVVRSSDSEEFTLNSSYLLCNGTNKVLCWLWNKLTELKFYGYTVIFE